MPVAFARILDKRDAVRGLCIEERRAPVLRKAVHAGLAEHFDEKHLMTAAVGEPQKRLVTRNVIITQIADDE